MAWRFFGATGQLDYKKILPALDAILKRGQLGAPVIRVAWLGWDRFLLKARARDRLENEINALRPGHQ